MEDLLRERLYMLVQGYSDCNDARYLKTDPTFKAILGRIEGDPDLASQPTLCRLENRITRQELKAMIIYPIEKWLESYKTVPNEIILDFPNVKIKLRADSGVAIPRFFDFLEDNTSQYAIALVTNKRLVKKNEPFIETAKRAFNCTQNKPRLFHAVMHDVDSWKKTRRVIAKAEVMAEGTNNRFVVTHMDDEPQVIDDDFYTQRGDSENDIKELKLGCHADRLSCHKFRANFFRLLLSTFAYQLMHYFKAMLVNTEFETATIQTIRLHLFKVALRVHRLVRRLWFNVTSSFVYQDLFVQRHQKILAIQ